MARRRAQTSVPGARVGSAVRHDYDRGRCICVIQPRNARPPRDIPNSPAVYGKGKDAAPASRLAYTLGRDVAKHLVVPLGVVPRDEPRDLALWLSRWVPDHRVLYASVEFGNPRRSPPISPGLGAPDRRTQLRPSCAQGPFLARQKRSSDKRKCLSLLGLGVVAGAGFEPATFGL